jgi:streptogramin lyase
MRNVFVKLLVLPMLIGVLALPIQAQQKIPADLNIEMTIPKPASSMAFGYGALWTMHEGRMLKIDGATVEVTEIEMPGAEAALLMMELDRYRGIAVGEGAVWLADMASSSIFRIDPVTNKVGLTITTDIFGAQGSIAAGFGSVWVVTFDKRDKRLTRYNAVTGASEAAIDLPEAGEGVLAAFGNIWVTAANRPALYRIDPASNRVVGTIATYGRTHLLAADERDSLWLWFDVEGVVQRVDAQTGNITATIETGTSNMESDGDIAIGNGSVWTINRASIVSRIDMQTNQAAGTYRPPIGTSQGRRLRFGSNSIWLSGNAIYRITPPN